MKSRITTMKKVGMTRSRLVESQSNRKPLSRHNDSRSNINPDTVEKERAIHRPGSPLTLSEAVSKVTCSVDDLLDYVRR